MSINKLFIKRLKPSAQWSPMIYTICLYILFIMVVLSISIPLKSHSKRKFDRFDNEHANKIGFMSNDGVDVDDVSGIGGGGGVVDGKESEDTVDNDVDDNQMGDDEHRFLQRARNLPNFSNRSIILRDAFQR